MKENTVQNINFLSNNLPNNFADLIIADPPYFEVKGEFDFIWQNFEDYLKDVEKWAKECKRILKDNGTLFWYGNSKKIAYSQIIIDKYFNLINNLVWNKGSFMGLEKSEGLRSFAPCTERILMYSNEVYNLEKCIYGIRDYIRAEIEKSKGKLVLKEVNKALGTATNGGGVASACLSLEKSEPLMFTEEMYNKLQKWCFPYLRKEYEELRKEYEELRKEYEELRRPFNNYLNLQEVLNFSNEATKTGSKYEHETVKPETLTRALITTCSRKGQVLVVPFAGSGTECSMGVKEGLKVYGFEIEKKHAETANKRIKKETAQQTLF